MKRFPILGYGSWKAKLYWASSCFSLENSISIITPNLRESYINYGREGILEGDPEGLFDYIRSQSGSSFEVAGFSSHSYTPVGYANMSEFSVKILDILKNGNY